MTEQADIPLPVGREPGGSVSIASGSGVRVPTRAPQRRVAGKAQLAGSAIGMAVALAALVLGDWLAAAAIFLATLVAVEVLFQHALVLFHGPSHRPALRLPVVGPRAPRPAAAGD